MKTRAIRYSLLGLLSSALIALVINQHWPAVPHYSPQLHSTVEAIGAAAALFLAYLLHHHQAGLRPGRCTACMQSGLIAMGMLDLFHAVAPPGDAFVWLHSAATLSGGLLFSLVWLPGGAWQTRAISLLPGIALLVSALLGMSTLLLPSTIPPMVVNNSFTGAAKGLNLTGGGLFLSAGAFFLLNHHRDRQRGHTAYFAHFCLLFGLAGVIFTFSRVWEAEWWIWHIVRLLACLFVVRSATELVQRANKRLLESQVRFRALFEQAAVGVAQIETETGRFVRANKKYCETTGYSPEDMENITFQQLTPREDRQRDTALMAALLKGETREFTMKRRHLRKDGSTVWVDVSVSPMWAAGDKPDYYIAVVRDITAMKQTEDALRRSESVLNEVGHIAKIGGWEMDLTSRTAKWTKTTYDILGIEYGQPIPGPDEHVDYYLPEFRPMVREAMRALVEENVPLSFEAQLRTAKGDVKWCQALGRAQFRDGKCVRLNGTFQDISEGKLLALSIRENERRFRTLVENIPGLVYRCQTAAPWRLEYVSESAIELTGHPAGDFMAPGDLTFGNLILDEDLPDVERVVDNGVSTRSHYEMEYRIRHTSGEIRWVSEKGRASYDEEGNPRWLDGVIIDITERKRVEMQVQEYADRQAVLLREVNHRVKNNLAVIVGMLHKEEDLADGKVQVLLREIEGRVKGLLTVHCMFSAANWQPLSLSRLCEQIVSGALEPSSKGIALTVPASAVRVDSNQAHHLGMVLNELATNSLKYATAAPAQTRIHIDIAEESGKVGLTFRDNGPGYPESIVSGQYAGNSTGFDLIAGIVQRSLHGTLSFRNENGAVADIAFSANPTT